MANETIKPTDISLIGGVLIIGSLLWDKEKIRIEWRTNYLDDVRNSKNVSAPIRYGRISKERNCTFTMIFSSECKQPGKLGKAKYVSFKKNPVNLKTLGLQATELIKAENKKEVLDFKRYNWKWGALGLCINPKHLEANSEKRGQATLLIEFWKKNYANGFNPEEYKVGHESPILTKDGLFEIDWTNDLEDIDFFIGTATKPDLKEYPKTKNIADRIIVNEYDIYFKENCDIGITTFQDNEISEYLNRQKDT